MLPSQLLRCRPASSWSANTLLAIVLLLASIVAVVLMFSLSGVSARAVCQRLRLANCYDPLPVVSRMAAFEPMYFAFACLVPPGAFLFRNSVAAYIDAHEPILDAFPPEARQDVWCGCALWTLSGAALLWWPVPCKAPARSRAHPRRLMFWVRVCVDLASVALAGLSVVSLAHSWWLHSFFSAGFFWCAYAMVGSLLIYQAQLRSASPAVALAVLCLCVCMCACMCLRACARAHLHSSRRHSMIRRC